MDELRVPKRRAQVEILLPGGAIQQVAVFLSEFASNHAGAERLSDLLNGSGDFFPGLAAEGELTCLNRACVAAARIPRDMEEDAGTVEQTTIPTEHEVEISLVDGTRLRGLLTYVLPPERSRLIDFLNDAPPFFKLFEGTQVTLVNKRHVARVVALQR